MAMICPNCEEEVPANSKFCLSCGKPLATLSEPVGSSAGTQKTNWISKNWRVVAVAAIIVLIVLPVVILLPVRVTVILHYQGDHNSVQILIDGEIVADLSLYSSYSTSIRESFSVTVGHHTMVVRQYSDVVVREVIMAWPLVGNSISCQVPEY
jgi:hypothetical protein